MSQDQDNPFKVIETKKEESPKPSIEKRQIPRISLYREQFRLNDNGKIYGVTNISEKGMAFNLLDNTESFLFPVGRAISGVLKIENDKFPVQLKVNHVRANEVGVLFNQEDPGLSSHVKKFLDPNNLGAEIREMPMTERGYHWFHGTTGTDILIKLDVKEKLDEAFLCIHGQYAEWSKSLGLRTGIIKAGSDTQREYGLIHIDSMEITEDKKPDKKKTAFFKSVLQASNMTLGVLSQCLKFLDK